MSRCIRSDRIRCGYGSIRKVQTCPEVRARAMRSRPVAAHVHPLVFEPLFKPRIWGGRRLETLLNKRLPPGVAIGESWEVVDLEEAQSVVAAGPGEGKKLGEWGQR